MLKGIITILQIALSIVWRGLLAYERRQVKQEGRDDAELDARREADRVSDAVRNARDKLRDVEPIDDPNNRRRPGNPVP